MARHPLSLGFTLRPCLLVLCLMAFLAVPRAAAEETLPAPWQISADRLTHYKEPEIIVAEGNVILTRHKEGAGPMVIKADWIRYDVSLSQVKARGNVSLKTDKYLIEAEKAKLLLDKQTGTLLDSTIQVPREGYILYLTGREIEKTGELTYHIRKGTVTSCPRTPDHSPPWTITSRDVRLKQGGIAVLKHATLHIKSIPVAYTPYMVFPANTERKSGFLLPELSNSERNGTGLILPYFLNLSPSQDVTFYPGYLSKRGPLAGLEARYVADVRSKGTFLLTYLQDRTEDTPTDDYLDDGILRTNHDRYWVRGKVDQYFSDSLVTRLDLDVVSDRDFLQEFRNGLLGYNATNREFLNTFHRGLQDDTVNLRTSTVQTVKSWDTVLLLGEVQAVDDVRDIPVPESAVQTLPRLRFDGRSLFPGMPFSLAWGTELVDYWRKRGIGYERLDLYPRLIASIPRGILEGHLIGGVRQTSYLVQTYGNADWNNERTQSRTLEDFEGEVATTIFRDFKMDLGKVKSLTHTFRPALIYNYLPSVSQQSLPFVDDVDRIEPRNWVAYRFDNYFDLGTGEREALAKRYLGYFRVSQTYDIREERRALISAQDQRHPLSDVLLELDTYPLPRLRLNSETAISVYGQGIPYFKVLSSYSDTNGNSLFVNYSYQRDPSATRPYFYIDHPTESEQKLALGLLTHLTNTISFQGSMTKVWRTEAGQDVDDLDQSVHILYHPSCWGLELNASRTSDDKRIALVFSLTGIGDLLGVGLQETGLQYEVL
ncbi:MAG: LPS assembly protein LptD [Deltaproteobacteria bacterium]